MRKIKVGIYLIVALSMALSVTPVFAAPPLGVHFEAYEEIANPGTPGPFSASGPAVDSGLMCDSGTVYDTSWSASGPPSGTFRILRVSKHFTCGDGSGEFDIAMVVRLDLTTSYTTATWRITGGTGDYAHLHGQGTLNGVPDIPNTSIWDYYDGKLH
jgi:hypothetical protein